MNKIARAAALGLILSALSSSCKVMPNSVRSGGSSVQIDSMLDGASLRFVRKQDQKSGNLAFTLKGEHSCRIEYWANDPNGTPPPASPMSLDCPEPSAQLVHDVEIQNLTPGYPLHFRIYVWPKTTSFLSHFVKDYDEGKDLDLNAAQELVIYRYNAPRQSAEVYTFRSPEPLTIGSIKAKVLALPSDGPCTNKAASDLLPFPRSMSQDDSEKRPLLGLSSLTMDGYSVGQAIVHPFYNTRLVASFEQITRQENWLFHFKWNDKPYDFSSFPPGYIGSLSLGDGTNSQMISTRSLAGSLETISLRTNRLKIEPKVLFPTDSSKFVLTIKSSNASEVLLSCTFKIEDTALEVPESVLASLPQGSYLATFGFETNQIHIPQRASYPPWILTSQDLVQFRLNKRL